MKFAVLAIVLAAGSAVHAQSQARATYSSNGKLVEVANLLGLSDCRVSNVSGKVSRIKVSEAAVRVVLRRGDERVDFNIPLANVNRDDKEAMFKHLVTKGNTLEIAGYRCSETDAPSAFSVRRVY